MNHDDLAMIIVMPLFFVISGWAFKTFLQFLHRQRLVKAHYALQDKLLDKLGSSPEAIEYLHSNAGEKLFASAIQERTNPFARILTALLPVDEGNHLHNIKPFLFRPRYRLYR